MKCKGDIKVWVDGERACARLTAEGSEGPIIVQASAPLADVRRRVARKLKDHGHEVSGDHPGFNALVNGVARNTALHRLETLAPALFVPGGVATFLALRELKRRRRAKALAQQRELAMKKIASAEEEDDGDFHDDRRGRGHHEFEEDDDGGTNHHSHGSGYGSSLIGWHRPRNRPSGSRIGAAATDAALAVAQSTPQVRAGMTVLKLARRNPRVRRQVATVVARAQNGDPHAQAQVRVLAKAKRVETAQKQQKTIAAGRSSRPSQRALLAPPREHTASVRLRDIFSAWHPDLIRRRGT